MNQHEENSPSYDSTFKIITAGDHGVGKTCFIGRFVEGRFGIFCTPRGPSFKSCDMKRGAGLYRLFLVDVCKVECRHDILTNSFFGVANGALLMFDTTRLSSFVSIARYCNEWLKDAPVTRCYMLIGTKCDLVSERVVEAAEAETLAAKWGLKYTEVSAKGWNRWNICKMNIELPEYLHGHQQKSLTAIL